MVEIDETEDENNGWLKVPEIIFLKKRAEYCWDFHKILHFFQNQINHIVARGINRDVTVTQYHLLRTNGCPK